VPSRACVHPRDLHAAKLRTRALRCNARPDDDGLYGPGVAWSFLCGWEHKQHIGSLPCGDVQPALRWCE